MRNKNNTGRITSITRVKLLILSMFLFMAFPGYSADVTGFFDTAVYTYSTVKDDLSGTDTSYRFYENILLDIKINDKLSFHTNDRIIYRGLEISKDENEDPEKIDLNIYYGYMNYKIKENFNVQLGRIMSINNLVYSYFDGVDLQYKFNLKKAGHKLAFGLYGGLLINDDYLEDDDTKDYGINSFDARNFYVSQRVGDYIAGGKANYFAKGIGIFTLDYQMTTNDNAIAEQYASIDFDTLFSRKLKFYGFGTFDLVDMTPSNTLAGTRYTPIELISISVEHEYYRPVYIKDSYFWTFFTPYAHQSVSGTLLFFISRIVTIETKYARIFYTAIGEQGDEVSATFEDRNFLGFGIQFSGDYLNGPEGKKITAQALLKRRFFNFINIYGGGGIIFFNEDESSSSLSKGYVGRAGADLRFFKKLILSGDLEYFNNPKYKYDIRVFINAKYLL